MPFSLSLIVLKSPERATQQSVAFKDSRITSRPIHSRRISVAVGISKGRFRRPGATPPTVGPRANQTSCSRRNNSINNQKFHFNDTKVNTISICGTRAIAKVLNFITYINRFRSLYRTHNNIITRQKKSIAGMRPPKNAKNSLNRPPYNDYLRLRSPKCSWSIQWQAVLQCVVQFVKTPARAVSSVIRLVGYPLLRPY